MKKSILALVGAVALALYGCNNGGTADYQPTTQIDEATLESADAQALEKVTKTAEIRFRVKDVSQAKTAISAQLKKLGGRLVESDIQSDIQRSEKVKYSADSLLEITSYKTEGKIVAKVPSTLLDDFADSVARKADFVDHRSLKFDDQTLAHLGNKIRAKNRIETVNSLNQQATKKSGNVETSLSIKDDYVEQKIKNLQIEEQVRFSTITLSFYQNNTISKLVVANDNLYEYSRDSFSGWG